MKYIHYPTLLLHGALLLLAKLLLGDYQDGFLLTAVILLLGYLILGFVSRRPLSPSHLLGCAIQFLVFRSGLIAATGLGSGLALFFYQIALAASAAALVLTDLIRRKHFQP